MRRYETDPNCPQANDEENRQSVGKRSLFIIGFVCGIMLLCAMLQVAAAQTTTRALTINWNAPTTCQGGSPITNCPILGYSIQKLTGTTWAQVGTTAAAVRTFRHDNQAIGTHTYRVLATSEAGPSLPSSEASKTIDVPGAPNGVVITVTVTITP